MNKEIFNKENIKNVLLGAIFILLVWNVFFKEEKTPEIISPVTIKVPEKEGTTGINTIEKVEKTVPVYIPQYKDKIVVDEKYKEMYEKSKDSVEKLNLYLSAIKITDYKETIDNDTIKLDLYAQTRGSLLNYKIDYKIKSQNLLVEPTVIYKQPRLSMGFGAEVGIPTLPSDFVVKGNMFLEAKNGNGLSVGYDTKQRIYVGITKKFTLVK